MSDYLDAELSATRRLRMERHVGACPECRRLLAGLRVLLGRLHDLPTPRGDADAARLATAVRQRLGDLPER